MASTRFKFNLVAPLLLMAAGATAHFQLDLLPTSPHALEYLSEELDRVVYDGHTFVGQIPWYPYSLAVDVGTPGSRQSMAVSLSHGDSWMLYSDLCLPNNNPNFTDYVRNCSSGSYGDVESTTISFNESESLFERYFDERVEGLMVKDTVRLGDVEMTSVDLGIALNTYLDTGFFGLGTPWQVGSRYAPRTTMIDEMVDQGHIGSQAFSIHAEDNDDAIGSILFGAVDRSKFDGPLQRIQASAAKEKFATTESTGYLDLSTSYITNVSAMWAVKEPGEKPRQYVSTEQGGSFYAAIDPTFALSNVPDYVARPIYEQVSPQIWSNIGMRTVHCNRTDLDMTVAIELGGEGGYRLNVTMQDLVVPADVWHIDDADFGETHCLFGIQSMSRSTGNTRTFRYDGGSYVPQWVIGGMLLRNTYTVFDAVNKEVSLAPLKSDLGGKADIVAFERSGEHAPESSFVGFEECFKNCEEDGDEKEDEGAGPHVVAQTGLVAVSALAALGFIIMN